MTVRTITINNLKVKLARYRLGEAQSVPNFKVSRFHTTAQDGGEVFSLMHRPFYLQEIYLLIISVRR